MLKLAKNKKLLVMAACMMLTLAFASVCFAASGDHLNNLDFTPIISSVTGAISPVDIIKIVAMTIKMIATCSEANRSKSKS